MLDWVCMILIILMAIDVHSTIRCLLEKKGTESNKFMQFFIDKFGMFGVVIAKLIPLVLILPGFFVEVSRTQLTIILFVYSIVMSYYILTIINNYRILYKK